MSANNTLVMWWASGFSLSLPYDYFFSNLRLLTGLLCASVYMYTYTTKFCMPFTYINVSLHFSSLTCYLLSVCYSLSCPLIPVCLSHRSLLPLPYFLHNSKLSVHHFDAWGGGGSNKEWHLDLTQGEEAVGLAVGAGFVAVATDQHTLRLFSVAGVQREVLCAAGKVVCVAAYQDLLMVVCHSGMGEL